MRHVDPPPPPAALASTKANEERDALIAFYEKASNRKKPYPKGFHAYALPGVREALTEAFHGKCAYCETNYKAAQPADIEHFRPKGGVTTTGSKPEPPGYWWLASDWHNLLPSCIDCNRPRGQDFPAGMPKTAGKANRFPLASEGSRATAPGLESKERRLLLHPYLDQPEKHLRFVTDSGTIRDGEVEPRRSASGKASRKGKVSIDVYALQRIGLIEKRREAILKLRAHLELVRDAKLAAQRHPDDPQLLASFRRGVEQMKLYIDQSSEYAGVCRQVIADFGAELFGG